MYKNYLIALTALLCLSAGSARAHLRDYLVTYPYWTLAKGKIEVETRNDFKNRKSGQTVYVHQTELEYGVTDRLTLGVYGVMEKEGARPLEYARTKIEGRYRLAEPGVLPMDPAFYLEYQKGANDRPDVVESKIILSKYLAGGTNLTLNGTLEREQERGSEWEKELTMGISRAISPKATAGLEVQAGETEKYVVPGVYLTLRPGMRMNIGTAFGMTAESDSFQLKMLTEFEF